VTRGFHNHIGGDRENSPWLDLSRIRGYWVFAARLIVLLLVMPVAGFAADADIVIVLSNDTREYRQISEQIIKGVQASSFSDKRFRVVVHNRLEASDRGLLTHAEVAAVIPVGIKALKAMIDLPARSPLYAVFVPRLSYEKILRASQADSPPDEARKITALFLDQPIERQMRLAKLLNPEFTRAGILLGENTRFLDRELDETSRMLKLKIVRISPAGSRQIVSSLSRAYRKIDFLLTVFDPDIISRKSAKQILYLSYNHRLPVIGYSRAMVKAGALAAVYSESSQIGRQAAETLLQMLEQGFDELPDPVYPAHFQVSCNISVMNYFHLETVCPDETFLRQGGE
jgi:hypothetical protein